MENLRSDGENQESVNMDNNQKPTYEGILDGHNKVVLGGVLSIKLPSLILPTVGLIHNV